MFGNTEIIVKKEAPYNYKLINTFLYAAVVIITALLYKAAGAVAFYPAPFLLVGAWLLARYLKFMANIEYEYSFTDGSFEVTRLVNQTKRVPVVQVEVNEISGFGKADEASLKALKENVVKTIRCCSEKEEDTHYYFICKYNDSGMHAFVFTPDEKLLKALCSRNQVISSAVRMSR